MAGIETEGREVEIQYRAVQSRPAHQLGYSSQIWTPLRRECQVEGER
jgi:hypothetical protein